MHLSSFFSLSTLPSAVFSALVFATLVEAQDRSTEQEEAQISEVLGVVNFMCMVPTVCRVKFSTNYPEVGLALG
ncbi:hypothetical protein ID866_2884 [Astraeus odoratus]|nr:hypothetical protein ID866_2884 [Astraeus odoratus]